MFTGGTEAFVLSSQLHSFPSDHQVALHLQVEHQVVLCLQVEHQVVLCLQVEQQVALCLQVEQRVQCSALSPVSFLLTTRWYCVYR